MRRFTIIVAGGSGQRLGSSVPKQFLELCGKPVLMHAIEKFIPSASEIILVLPMEFTDYWKKLCIDYTFNQQCIIATGGRTRTESVMNGLALVNEPGIVAIHDAARPLVSKELIEKLFSVAAIHGNAIPVVDVDQSLRKVVGNKNLAVSRNDYKMVQTPQCFDIVKLKEAYAKIGREEFTDDATVFEANGNNIVLETGEYTNFKITSGKDMIIAESLLKYGL